MKTEMKVNEATARLFYEQCMGDYPGHMGRIPYHPVLKSICESCGVRDEQDFRDFMNLISEKLGDHIQKESHIDLPI